MVDFRILTESVTDATVMPMRRPTVVASRPGDPAPSGSGEGVTVTTRDGKSVTVTVQEAPSGPVSATRPVAVPDVPAFPENGPGCYPATYQTETTMCGGRGYTKVIVDAPCNDDSNRCYLVRADVFEAQKDYLQRLLVMADEGKLGNDLGVIADWSRKVCISVSTALNALNARYMTARYAVSQTESVCATLEFDEATTDRFAAAADIDSFPTVTEVRRAINAAASRATSGDVTNAVPLMMPKLNGVEAGVAYRFSPGQPIGPERKMPRSRWCRLAASGDDFEIVKQTWLYSIYGDGPFTGREAGSDLYRTSSYERCGLPWNHPLRGTKTGGGAVYGPRRQIEYCKTWIRAILNLDPYRYSQQAMQRWTATMQPWVAAGLMSADALELSEQSSQAVYDRRKAVADRPFQTAGAVGGSAASVASAIPGAQTIAAVGGLLSAVVGLIPGAVGGFACPELPVLRILREQDCPTSRLINPSTVTPPTQTRTEARVSGGAIALWGLGGAVVGYLLLEGLRRK